MPTYVHYSVTAKPLVDVLGSNLDKKQPAIHSIPDVLISRLKQQYKFHYSSKPIKRLVEYSETFELLVLTFPSILCRNDGCRASEQAPQSTEPCRRKFHTTSKI